MTRKIKEEHMRRMFHNDGFMLEFGNYLEQKKKGDNLLTEKRYTIKDTDSTYRAINHWSNLGLFDDPRADDKKGWRKFSIVDLTWLRILTELRKFGLSLEKIKFGYESIRHVNEFLEFGVMLCFFRRAFYLIIYSDGFIEVATKTVINISESLGLFNETSYLVISLNAILKDIFPEKNFKPELDTFTLSQKEIQILDAIRSGNEEVSIHMKNGTVDRIDTKKKHVGEIGKLADILNKVSHGNFTIKKDKGEITFVEVVEKKKV